jgi:alanine racemase
MEASYNLGIFEAGISMQNEMSCLQKIIYPEIGILSHIGNAHQEGFNSIQQKMEEKLPLFLLFDSCKECGENVEDEP